MKFSRWVAVAGLCLSGIQVGSAAPLAVIYDSGDTQPLAPLLEGFGEPPESTPSERPDPLSLGAGDLRQILPIKTPELTPGPVRRQTLSRPFAAPLFLVGSDPLSLRWVVQHRAALSALGAVGLVVDIPDEAALNRVIAAAQGLNLLPASGADLARTLGLTHYPVLITKDGITQ